MQNYKYVAIDLERKKYTGVFTAKDESDLAAQLARQNLFLVSATPYSGKTPSAFFTMGTGSVNMAELTTFCRQFAIMINSGISILECIESLKTQPFSAFFKNLLQVIYEDVKSGVVLSEALDKHKKVFPEFFRSMVHVGEASGKLDEVFRALADYYEKDAEIRRKVKSALSYPLMLIGMTIGIVILMLAYIVPTFKDTLSGLDVTPTGFTKFVYDVSDFLSANWSIILLAIVVIVGGIFLFSRTKTGKYIFSMLAMKLPVFKKVQISLISSRFASAFSLLLSSGLDMAQALVEVKAVITNEYFRKQFEECAENVSHGVPLSKAFEQKKLFPQVLIQMISVGEKTATLEDVLSRSCAFFDEQAQTTLEGATSKLQPIILIFMGIVIGSLFIAVYSPIISIMTGLT